ncbi:hypothetical protein P9112_007281 [Eukaryota sp. TZLM1-RC]
MLSVDYPTTNESHMSEFEQSDAPSSRFLSVFFQHGKLGVATFDLGSNELLVVETPETTDFPNLTLLKFQINPTTVLCSSSANEQLVSVCSAPLNDDQDHSVDVVRLKSQEFSVSGALKYLKETEFLELPSRILPDERLISLAHVIDFNSVSLMSALSGLLFHIQNNVLFSETLRVAKISNLLLEGSMFIDLNTMKSLQILPNRSSLHTTSLLEMFSNTNTPMGKRLMEIWFNRPLNDSEILQNRQNIIELLKSPHFHPLITQLTQSLKMIKDLPKITIKIRSNNVSVKEYLGLLSSCVGLSNTSQILNSVHFADCKLFSELHSLLPIFCDVHTLIDNIFDGPESSKSGRFCAQVGISEQLDQLKYSYETLEDILTQAAHNELNELPISCPVSKLNVVYYPQLGYLVAVDNSEASEVPAHFELQFSTSDFHYFKTSKCRTLDEEMGDIHGSIIDTEAEIERELLESLAEYVPSLLQSSSIIAEIDCLLVMASIAVENRYCKPELVTDNVIEITEGRHPLAESCLDVFVPNSTRLSPHTHSMQVITGPNYSGKSIYLKQIGLIVFMAQIGSFVPAKSAKIGLVDLIDSRIRTDDSMNVVESSFILDCQQVAGMLKNATNRSLLLLDEFGKGSDTVDGAALMGGILNSFIKKQENPFLIATTHFTELIMGNYLQKSPRLQFLRMDVHSEKEETSPLGRKISYLYKVVPGHSYDSFALHCALRSGLPEDIVNRASELSHSFRHNHTIQPLTSQKPKCLKICSALLDFDLEKGKINDFIRSLSTLK